ncbi:hypothetical protein ACFX15_030796 [Malus domestica]
MPLISGLQRSETQGKGFGFGLEHSTLQKKGFGTIFLYPCLKNLTIFLCGFTTFGEGNDVIVLEAEAALSVAEALTDDVASGVSPPPLRVSTRHHIHVCPALALCFLIEEPWSFVTLALRRAHHTSHFFSLLLPPS